MVQGIELLDEAEMMRRLSISRSTLRRLMKAEAIVPVHIGKSVRFTAAELRRFVDHLEAVARSAGNGDR